ncbi:MAG TPA: hypothetical protein VJI46_02300 [Candidatus Nanoarchaeia archaeon]|nr:hypothetical protein [Candidatus Nanoarchaeia archaeon]
MEELMLLVAQVSSVLTTIIGAVSLAFLFLSLRKLLAGELKNIFIIRVVFLLAVVLGVAAMTVYHLTEESQYQELSETMEGIWYIFIFVTLIASLFETYKVISFWKPLSEKKFKKHRH